MVSHPVPANPFSTIRTTVRIAIHAKVFLVILNALYVLNPSLLQPAQTPKMPSNHNTEQTAKYCSMFSIDKSKKYVHKYVQNAVMLTIDSLVVIVKFNFPLA